MAINTTLTLKFNGSEVKKGLADTGKALKKFAGLGLIAGMSMLKPFAQLAALLGPTAIVGGLASFAQASSESASRLENLTAEIEIFTGSAKKTQEILGDLRKLAVESPLELSDISDGAKMLLNYGVSANSVTDIVSRLSEVSAGNASRFERLALAYGQASSVGRLMGTELRQFTEAGFNPLEAIAQKTGETMLNLKKRMEDGKVTIDELKESLIKATSEGGRFYGLNKKMSNTFSGRVSMMKDQWDQLTATFGSGMNAGLMKAIDAVSTNLPLFKERFKEIGNIFGYAIGEAVGGDTERFAAIGTLIGEYVKIGFLSVFESLGTELVKYVAGQFEKNTRGSFIPTDILLNQWSRDIAGVGFGKPEEILQANMINSQARRDQLMETIKAPSRVGFTDKRPMVQSGGAADAMSAGRLGRADADYVRNGGGVPGISEVISLLRQVNQSLKPAP